MSKTKGVTCASCKSVLFSIDGLINHKKDNPTHRVYTFEKQYPDGALVIKLLLDIEEESENYMNNDIEEKPECLHIGPALRSYDDTEHDEEREAEDEHYEFACQYCKYADGCRWAQSMKGYWGEEDEDWNYDEYYEE